MKDRDFLIWIHERLILVHGENVNFDYMNKLRSIIEKIPEDQETPNTSLNRIENGKMVKLL